MMSVVNSLGCNCASSPICFLSSQQVKPLTAAMNFMIICMMLGCLVMTSTSEVDPTPQYEFHYAIHDVVTGDVKDQFEHRRGDYVTGRYSLIEPDGNRRIVDYSADPILGFTAQVRREPIVQRY